MLARSAGQKRWTHPETQYKSLNKTFVFLHCMWQQEKSHHHQQFTFFCLFDFGRSTHLQISHQLCTCGQTANVPILLQLLKLWKCSNVWLLLRHSKTHTLFFKLFLCRCCSCFMFRVVFLLEENVLSCNPDCSRLIFRISLYFCCINLTPHHHKASRACCRRTWCSPHPRLRAVVLSMNMMTQKNTFWSF